MSTWTGSATESFQASELSVDVFCLQEGVFALHVLSLEGPAEGRIPDAIIAEKEARDRAESAEGAAFVPISLKASPVEIQLPNGGVVRLPLGVGQAVLVEAIRAVRALRPWKAPQS